MNLVIRNRVVPLAGIDPSRAGEFTKAVLSIAKPRKDGALEIPISAFADLAKKHAEPRFGLGDLVHAVAKPIAVALGLDCIDPATRELRPESPCAKRREKLNAIQIS